MTCTSTHAVDAAHEKDIANNVNITALTSCQSVTSEVLFLNRLSPWLSYMMLPCNRSLDVSD